MGLFGPPNIAQLKQRGDVNGLCGTLSHKDHSIRLQAAEALGDLTDSRAVQPLATSLREDANTFVRRAAATALGRLNDLRVVEPLIAALRDDSDHSVRGGCAAALGKIGD